MSRPIQARADRAQVIGEILFQNDELWRDDARPDFDPRQTAWIETDNPRKVIGGLSGSQANDSDCVEIDRYEPERVELTAALGSPGLVTLADAYYPCWKLTVDDRPAEILRANRMMRGAVVGSGKNHLVYTCQPDSLKVESVMSIVGTLGLILFLMASRRRPG